MLKTNKQIKKKPPISLLLSSSMKRNREAPVSATTLLLESMLNKSIDSTKKVSNKRLKTRHIQSDATMTCTNKDNAPTVIPTTRLSMLHGKQKKTLLRKAVLMNEQQQRQQQQKQRPVQVKNRAVVTDSSASATATKDNNTPTTIHARHDVQRPARFSLQIQRKQHTIQRSRIRSTTDTAADIGCQMTPYSFQHHTNEEQTILPPVSLDTTMTLKPILSNTTTTVTTNAKPWASAMEQAATTIIARQQPQPPLSVPTSSSNDNFVKLNLRNAAGACRGAKTRKTKSFRHYSSSHDSSRQQQQQQQQQRGGMTACGEEVAQSNIKRRVASSTSSSSYRSTAILDPLDDFLDGTFQSTTTTKPKTLVPVCARHARPCQLHRVKKNTSGNKGRQFYSCGMPRGEQCNHFEWAENTLAAAQQQLVLNHRITGFVARQVASYMDRFKTLTVPELRQETKRRGLDGTGNKQPLLLRLSLWVRDEVCKATLATTAEECDPTEPMEEQPRELVGDDHDYADDNDSSESELEIEGEMVTAADSDEDDDDESVQSFGAHDKCDGIVQDDMERTSTSCRATLSPLQQSLFELFGYSSFRDGQEWAIGRCLNRQRTLLVAPTGFGKSLCYSLPASMMEGTCIVISPLISLIEDQLIHLPPRIPAATLSGGMAAAKLAAVIDDVLRNRIKILFVSPERLTTASFRRLFRPKWNEETKAMERPFPTVSLLCVDEAHCLSQWAHNFRPSYLRIRSLMDLIQPASVLAVTATAGPKVIDDICRSLRIPRGEEVTTKNTEEGCDCGVKILGCDRDNIDVACVVMASEESRLHMLSKLMSECSIKNKTVGPLDDGSLSKGNIIIYVWRKRDTEVIAETLIASGISGGVVVYHGGMDAAARSKAQSRFMRGKARVCVCTVAFGLGINKSDVDAVIHLNLPASPEHYLQEIGRAGRDGRAAKAIALVLQNEVVVRHSLGHSDLISESQVMTLLRILRAAVQSASLDMTQSSGIAKEVTIAGTLHVALPLDSTVAAIDLKAESVETLLSLMEEHCPEDPLIRVEGKLNDLVTILLKRRHLHKLAVVEHVATCIQTCGRRIDNDIKKPEDEDAFSRRAALEAYSFGLYEFSVTRCATLLGPHAEARHVFAALRRLQNSGEIELSFPLSSLALQVKVEEKGKALFIANDDALHSLAIELTRQSGDHVNTGAQKVLDINDILAEVSEVQDDPKSSETENITPKSARLVRFQNLMNQKFAEPNTTVANESSAAFKTLSASDERNVDFDSVSLLRDLLSARLERSSDIRTDLSVTLCEIQFPDYTAICLTKFFHGIAMVRTPYSNFASHPLFGKWKHVQFDSVHSSVKSAISAIALEASRSTLK